MIASLQPLLVCIKHNIISKLRPVPTIMPESPKRLNLLPVAILEAIKTTRKAATARLLQKEKLNDFKKIDSTKCMDDIVSKGSKRCEKGVFFDQQRRVLYIYKIECKRLFSTWWTISNAKSQIHQ